MRQIKEDPSAGKGNLTLLVNSLNPMFLKLENATEGGTEESWRKDSMLRMEPFTWSSVEGLGSIFESRLMPLNLRTLLQL